MNISWVFITWATAFKEVWSKRTAFWLDVGTMCVNDTVWLGIYGVFFHNSNSMHGWTIQHMYMYFAVATSVYGVVAGFLANSRKLGAMAADGQLDAALTVPVDTLTYLLVRKVSAFSVGDTAFGFILFLASGHPTPLRLVTFFTVVALGSVILTSFLVLLGASTLLLGGRGDQGAVGFDAIATFAMYPIDFFTSGTKLILYTVIPTAFITGIPAHILFHFSVTEFALLIAVSTGFALAARATFNAGIRRYRSGSQWTTS